MKKKLGVFIVILLIIIAIGCIVYFGFIKNNDDTLEDVSNEEEIIESDETVDWGSIYTIFLLEEEEEEFEIGLFDFNSDDIPELLVKSDDLYKIVYINEEKEAETSSVKDEEIDNLSLVYNNEEQKYYYAYTTIDNEDEINIILDDLTEIPEIIDTSSEEYENDFVIITEDLQEQLEEIIEKDEDKINQAIENAKNYFKTTDEYVKESEIDVESGELDNVLSDDEAIEIGEELYSYGDDFGYEYDESTYITYIGNSHTEMVLSEIEELQPYRAYKVEDTDVEDYFTEKRIEELSLDNEPAPYGLEKYNETWYYCEPDLGGSYDYVGTEIELESVEKNKITFRAITYYSEEYVFNTVSFDESIDEIKENYEYHTQEDDFIIVKEDGKWKIDEQTVRF